VTEPLDLTIGSSRVVLPGGVAPAWIGVREGRIHSIEQDRPSHAGRVLDCGDLVVMAGVVDPHVHFNQPGRTEWEGFATGTSGAAAGGVTCVIDMPLNCDPLTTTRDALERKRASIAPDARIDFCLWGGIVPGNTHELRAMHDAGVPGFKCFLVDSGIEGFGATTREGLLEAMREIATLGSVLLVHAEDPARVRPAPSSARYADYLASRPIESETSAIETVIDCARETGCRTHVVHVSSGAGAALIRDAAAADVPISGETCAHYLTFASDEIPDGATEFKCAPPIREPAERDALWDALLDGSLSMVTSDHSPCPPSMKPRGDFSRAWGGVSSVELLLRAVWSGASARGIGIERVAEWLCDTPARLARLPKGRLAPGYDADLVVWNPEEHHVIDATRLHQRHPVTPYDARTLTGRVHRTFVRGTEVFGPDADERFRGREVPAR